MHANAIGRLLGAYPIIVPPSPGVLRAWGDTTTILRHELTKTRIRVLAISNLDDIGNTFKTLSTKAQEVMCMGQGVQDDMQVSFESYPVRRGSKTS